MLIFASILISLFALHQFYASSLISILFCLECSCGIAANGLTHFNGTSVHHTQDAMRKFSFQFYFYDKFILQVPYVYHETLMFNAKYGFVHGWMWCANVSLNRMCATFESFSSRKKKNKKPFVLQINYTKFQFVSSLRLPPSA